MKEKPHRSLAFYEQGRDNNFNLLRALLASAVLLHHAAVLTGNPVIPHGLATRFLSALGEIAVDGFFVVSGLLVTRSLIRHISLSRFALSRALRIYPGLWAMLLLLSLTLAFESGAAMAFLREPEVLRYVALTSTALLVVFDIPGVFAENPSPAINGSLWSLPFEVSCYLVLGLAGACGVERRPWLILAAFIICASIVTFPPLDAGFHVVNGARLGMYFGLGGLAAAYAERVPLHWSWLVVLTSGALLMDVTVAGPVFWAFAYAYALIWAAHVPAGKIRAFNRLPDISYGIYIYAFPIQQLLISSGVGLTPGSNLAIALPFVILLATASWYLVEKPAPGVKPGGRRGQTF